MQIQCFIKEWLLYCAALFPWKMSRCTLFTNMNINDTDKLVIHCLSVYLQLQIILWIRNLLHPAISKV